jgi:hypothetical protein
VTSVFRSPSRLVCNYQREAIVKKLVPLVGLLILGGALGLVVASCGSAGGSSPVAQPTEPHSTPPTQTRSTPPTQVGSNPYPYTNPIKRAGSSPARLAGDGRYFGYVRAADGESQPHTIGFDVAQFFFGEDVQKAAEDDGAVAPGEAVSNDHYERDRKREVRLLPLAPDAQVTPGSPASFLLTHVSHETLKKCSVQPLEADCAVSPSEFFAAAKQMKEYAAGYPGIPVWVTIHDGLVVRIDEQYFP